MHMKLDLSLRYIPSRPAYSVQARKFKQEKQRTANTWEGGDRWVGYGTVRWGETAEAMSMDGKTGDGQYGDKERVRRFLMGG